MPAVPTLARLSAVFALLAVLAGPAFATPSVEGPTATVEKLHATLLESMKEGGQLGYQGRIDRIGPVLEETFNFQTIGRVVTGRHWKALGADQRSTFVDTFRKLSTATYADNFSSYGGEVFETLGEEVKKETSLVRTQILKTDGKTVSLNYVLQKAGDRWRIVNVIAEGVSDLALKRTEYGAVIAKEGIDALIARLDAKIASYFANNK
jgi:phospholipid transport system substrate-binding protein